MNFHKTIGYLAAFLLMVGLGVPDSFAQPEAVSKITLSVTPRTLRDSTTTTTTPVTVTATVGVTLADNAGADGQDVAIDIEGTDDNSYSMSGNTGLTVPVPAGKSSGSMRFSLLFTFSGDDDPDDEKITMNATDGTANVAVDDRPVITITDHAASLTPSAKSIRGMRVVITTPKADAWAPTGKDKIKVQVLRKGQLASEFGAFSSIKVGLHQDDGDGETEAPDPELYSLIISNAVQLGSLVIPRIRTATLTGVTAAANGNTMHTTNNKAFYTRRSGSTGYDKLEFRFHLTGGASYDKVYAVVTFGLTEPDDEAPTMIESRDTKTSIFPQSPSGFDKVGDGKFIKIDAGVPAVDIVSAVNVTIINRDGEETVVNNDGMVMRESWVCTLVLAKKLRYQRH